jgi:hypothetical protein
MILISTTSKTQHVGKNVNTSKHCPERRTKEARMSLSHSFHILSLSFIFFMIPSTVFAYIDPGAASYFFQILMASVFSMLFAIKMTWRNIKAYIKRFTSGTQPNKHDAT